MIDFRVIINIDVTSNFNLIHCSQSMSYQSFLIDKVVFVVTYLFLNCNKATLVVIKSAAHTSILGQTTMISLVALDAGVLIYDCLDRPLP